MKQLSRSRFEAAVSFLDKHGRDLDKVLYTVFFQGAETDRAEFELTRYQRDNGGFGLIEPDIQARLSTGVSTAAALELMRELDLSEDHPIVTATFEWLGRSFDRGLGAWRAAPAGIWAWPHAPWWAGEKLEERFGGFRINPTAELLAYVYHFRGDIPMSVVEAAQATVVEALRSDREIDMHELLCLLRSLRCSRFPDELVELYRSRAGPAAERLVQTEPTAWTGYGLKPLQVAPTPQDFLYPKFKDLVNAQLNFEIKRQDADGSWAPTWDWGGLYPETWPAIEYQWKSVLTLQMLRALDAHGRIAS
ncbi:MAG: hypothetical protein EA425_05190 [Puniceicoccaceae bacterium]|nr:MAG: hypothetical protein EA425_05190 [Puniceicoccaceae bacterium]